MVHIAIALLRAYRYALSPLLGPRCRFMPSCSEYAIGALQGHGAVLGSWLTARRLCKCHPWHPGGYDPVPQLPRAPASGDNPDAHTQRQRPASLPHGNETARQDT